MVVEGSIEGLDVEGAGYWTHSAVFFPTSDHFSRVTYSYEIIGLARRPVMVETKFFVLITLATCRCMLPTCYYVLPAYYYML